MQRDWTGNRQFTFSALGASNPERPRAEHDYYATDPKAVDALRKVTLLTEGIWECACGEGHLSRRFEELGFRVTSTDLVDRGYGVAPVDFLKTEHLRADSIVTNPPFRYALEFARHGVELNPLRLCLFLRVQFLEGKERRRFFDEHPPYRIAVFTSRIKCARNGDFDAMGQSAVCYAWFIWKRGFHGRPEIVWI